MTQGVKLNPYQVDRHALKGKERGVVQLVKQKNKNESPSCFYFALTSLLHSGGGRQHCRLTICNELVELTNSETAAATPLGGGAKSLRSLSSLETGSVWRFLVN